MCWFGLYFVKDENNFVYPMLQVGSGSDKKLTDPELESDPHPWLDQGQDKKNTNVSVVLLEPIHIYTI